jgi:hypothetical protein
MGAQSTAEAKTGVERRAAMRLKRSFYANQAIIDQLIVGVGVPIKGISPVYRAMAN